ncbi:MAG: hypothetical protein Q7T33_01245, partial [Dehalococcoidia bacterium]|nr:hypothetical protein [Dehalococcoidia bacterium]
MMKRDIENPSWYMVSDFGGGRLTASRQISDARGRFIEVNYHNVTRPLPSTNPQPVVPTSFLGAASTPERASGLYLDADLRRLTSGTVADRRSAARYRLRYAVGVEDLSGHLLLNPRGDMNTDWRDAANDYRRLPPWLDHHAYALHNMALSWASNYWFSYRAVPARLGHVMRGRGNSANADRAWAGRVGLPAAFPMMFRWSGPPWTEIGRWHGLFADPDPNEGGRLYSYGGSATWEKILRTPPGGHVLTPTGQSPSRPYVHALLGPQLSWFNLIAAIRGPTISYPYKDELCEPHYQYSSGWGDYWSAYTTLYSLYG